MLPLRAPRRERLEAEIARLFAERGGRDGSPRITAALREAGWRVSENTVAMLMRGQGLAVRPRKKRRVGTRQGKGRWRASDRVRRKFATGAVNRRWYADGTEVKTGEGKLYLDTAAAAPPLITGRNALRAGGRGRAARRVRARSSGH